MKITLITHRYPTPDRPDLIGDVQALHIFARQWIKQGHDVTVVHLYIHENRDSIDKPPLYGYRVHETQVDEVPVLRVECRHIRRAPALSVLYFGRVARAVGGLLGKPDLLLMHFPTIYRGFPERLPIDAPRVAVLHTTDIAKLRNAGARFAADFTKPYAAIGFRSKAIKEQFHQLVNHAKPEFMVYSGAPEMPDIAPRRTEDGIFRVIYAGTLIPRKQVTLVLRALANLPARIDWRFTVIGEGEQREALEVLIDALGARDRVTLTGKLPRAEVLRLMGEQDVFAMISTRETLGLVYLEAMGQGLITIGTRGEGIDGIIEDGMNGFFADPNDEAELTALFERVADMPTEQRKAIQNAARETARRMNESDMARAYLNDAMACVEAKNENPPASL